MDLSGADLAGHYGGRDQPDADGLQLEGSLYANVRAGMQFRAAGAVRLHGAQIGGQLSLGGADLAGHDGGGISLTGDGLQVDGGLFAGIHTDKEFRAVGAIRLLGAHIGGELNLNGADLAGQDEGGTSLQGDWLQVGGGLFAGTETGKQFRAVGAIRPLGAHIQGQLSFSGAELAGHDMSGVSLLGQSMRVDQGLFLATDSPRQAPSASRRSNRSAAD